MNHTSLALLSQTILLLDRQLAGRQSRLALLYAPGALRQSTAFYRSYREAERLANRITALERTFCQNMDRLYAHNG